MSIEVHVRVRPGVANPVWSSAETVLYSTANTNTRYIYNKVHPSNSSNHTIFQGIEAIVHAAFDGKNVTVMAYGQTGSGKTYSMIGTENDAGVVPRTAKLLLELKKIHPGTTVQAYYTEIYNESVKDLLEPQRGELALHDAPDGGVTFEKRMVQVESFDDFLRLQSAAERNRKYGVTNLNDHSSRSHIILTFEIHRAHRTQKSVINLVDLAGSESAARANTEGMSLREGGFINRSLLTLGNVVDAIVDKRPYIPYRDAKLTRILRTCLGGSGITFILCCINPSRENYEQTTATLRFTQRAMKIKNDPVVVLNMPPLFVHQYAAGATQLVAGLQESADAEYQRGLRDAYMYCNNTAGSVVSNFQAQVSDSMHALANAQRLLIAHDHAMGMDRVGRLYNQMNELTRQRAKNQDIVDGEKKREREIAEEIEHRKEKLRRLEAELAEKEAAADTDLAGWEYQLHEARQKQVGELDLFLRSEETRRARIGYEWAVCMERIASRFVPALMNSLSSAAAEDAVEEGSGAERDVAGRGTSKAIALLELRERLTKARAELADLELAHEMVRDDIEEARRAQSKGAANGAIASELAALSRNRDVSDVELGEQIALLEQEEQQLRAQAKREIRRESLRRVRESLRRSSRSPQSGKLGSNSRSVTPQQAGKTRSADGRRNQAGGKPDDAAMFEDNGTDEFEDGFGNVPNTEPDRQRYLQPTNSSSRRGVGTRRAGGGGRSRSNSATATATRDSYADGVRNALSVLDSLKNRLMLQQQQQGDGGERANRAAKARHVDSASPANNNDDPASEEPTFLDIFGKPSPGSGYNAKSDEKENYYGYQSRPGQSKRYASAKPGSSKVQGYGAKGGTYSRQNTNTQLLEMVAEDDEAFASSRDQPSPGDVTPPIVGIAARRKWDRQTSNSNPPQRLDVERTLYPLHSNSQSLERPSP